MADDCSVKVLLVDDHDMVAESFRRVLDADASIDVVGVVGTVASAIDAAALHAPDVVLMDYLLPDGTGVEAARAILSTQPDTRVIVLTGSGSTEALPDALEAGCVGYIEKTTGLTTLAPAVRAAAAGELVISAAESSAVIGLRRAQADVASLTRREREVLSLVADGLSNRAVADRLTVSVHTVRTHVQTILAKLEAHSKLEAVAVARRKGLLSKS